MNDDSDYQIDMNDGPISPEQFELLLKGKLDPSQLSGPAKHIAELINAAKSPATEAELANQASMVSSFKAAMVQGSITNLEPERKRRMLSKLLAAKIAGAALAATALSGTAVAAFNGDLPSSVQSSLSGSLSKVGISIPSSTTSGSSSSSDITLPKASVSGSATAAAGSKNGLTNGVDQGLANGNSLFGLCTAYLSSTGASSSSTSTTGASTTTSSTTSSTTSTTSATSSTSVSGSLALQRLQAYAHSKGESVTQLCGTSTHPSGHSSSGGQSFGQSQAKAHNQTNSHFPFSGSSSTTTSASTSSTTDSVNQPPTTYRNGKGGNPHSNGRISGSTSVGISHSPFGG
ncbi:MAG: hypothetical protein M1288_05380 [Actinobacteria bacterium]|nr:hypothetical protein [Actinomycetota bacterium]